LGGPGVSCQVRDLNFEAGGPIEYDQKPIIYIDIFKRANAEKQSMTDIDKMHMDSAITLAEQCEPIEDRIPKIRR
jgi:hypothetical protein